jgi:predicted neuraminidase
MSIYADGNSFSDTGSSACYQRPSYVVRYDGRNLVQFFRTAVGKIYRSESANGGMNWTRALPVDLPNPNSKLNAIVLSDGQTAIAYNSHDRTGGYKLMRVNLTVAISPDRGKTWQGDY